MKFVMDPDNPDEPAWKGPVVNFVASATELNIKGHDTSRTEIVAFRDKSGGETCNGNSCAARERLGSRLCLHRRHRSGQSQGVEGPGNAVLLSDSTRRHRRLGFLRKPERRDQRRNIPSHLGGLTMVDQNLILIAYIVPIAFGMLMMTKAGDNLAGSLTGFNPLLAHARRRHLLGLNIVAFTGFVVSTHTLWISNKISEGGNVCSSATVFSCDDVLGNGTTWTPLWNLWGLIGMFAFAALLFITNSVGKEPDALCQNPTCGTGCS